MLLSCAAEEGWMNVQSRGQLRVPKNLPQESRWPALKGEPRAGVSQLATEQEERRILA